MAKQCIESDFKNYWNNLYPELPALDEFRPQKAEYEESDSELKYREWLKSKEYSDFRLDFWIDLDYYEGGGFGAEFQGQGWSHSGSGAQRDMRKNNQYVKMGFHILTFSADMVKKDMEYVAEQIYEAFENNYEI